MSKNCLRSCVNHFISGLILGRSNMVAKGSYMSGNVRLYLQEWRVNQESGGKKDEKKDESTPFSDWTTFPVSGHYLWCISRPYLDTILWNVSMNTENVPLCLSLSRPCLSPLFFLTLPLFLSPESPRSLLFVPTNSLMLYFSPLSRSPVRTVATRETERPRERMRDRKSKRYNKKLYSSFGS